MLNFRILGSSPRSGVRRGVSHRSDAHQRFIPGVGSQRLSGSGGRVAASSRSVLPAASCQALVSVSYVVYNNRVDDDARDGLLGTGLNVGDSVTTPRLGGISGRRTYTVRAVRRSQPYASGIAVDLDHPDLKRHLSVDVGHVVPAPAEPTDAAAGGGAL